MQRYQQLGPRDEQTESLGDTEFLGVNMRIAPDQLARGFVAKGINVEFDDRRARTRKGVVKPTWLNRWDGTTFSPFQDIHGGTTFRDPNSKEWAILAADGAVFRGREGSPLRGLTMPEGCVLVGRVNFIQRFNALVLQQGVRLPNLVLTDMSTGFELAVADWDPAETYAEDDEVAYGTEVEIEAFGVYSTDIWQVTTTARHGYQTGDRVYIYHAWYPGAAGAFSITRLDDFSFTFTGDTTDVPLEAVTITSVGTLCTVTTPTPHGLVTGRRVTIAGAAETDYNGTFSVTVTGLDTFTYVAALAPSASPGTGSPTWVPVAYASRQTKFYRASAATAAGESPITTTAKWTEITAGSANAIAPWTLGAAGLQNRIFWPYDKDLVASGKVLDEVHTESIADVFKVNQGDADELVALAAFGDRSLIGFKRKRIYVLGNVYGDLSLVTQAGLPADYGCVARRAVCNVGKDLWFLSAKGIHSLRLTSDNAVQGRDRPVSHAIEPLMRRINGRYVADATAMAWGNKVYFAVPLDDARTYSTEHYFTSGKVLLFGRRDLAVVEGAYYQFTPDEENTAELYNGEDQVEPGSVFRAAGPTVQVRSAVAKQSYIYELTLQRVYLGNNALLVFNLLNDVPDEDSATGARAFGSWEGMHQGAAICVRDFFTIEIGGVERLCFTGADGFVNLIGEGKLDQVSDGFTSLARAEIESELVTRGYSGGVAGLKRMARLRAVLGTWRPSFSVEARFEGADEGEEVVSDVTRDRTKWTRPWDRADWDETNIDDDHGDSDREDYSIALDEGDPLYLGSGVDLERIQETPVSYKLTNGRNDRFVQLKLTNTQGFCELRAVEFDAAVGTRSNGTHV